MIHQNNSFINKKEISERLSSNSNHLYYCHQCIPKIQIKSIMFKL